MERPVTSTVEVKLGMLRGILRNLGSVVTAFSGGADSAFLAFVAHEELGPDWALAVTAVSPSLAPEEEEACRLLAAEWGLRWEAVHSDELANPAYAANDGERCYHCKAELMDVVGALLARLDRLAGAPHARRAVVALGVNVDDLGEHRPGQRAAAERGAVFPLVEAGFTKDEVRAASRMLGLPTWDKPAAACLASRVPYGTPVTIGVLASVAQAESGLRALGFAQLRVRHYGDLARIEVPVEDLGHVFDRRAAVVDAVRSAGYRYVTIDLEGFRSGNLNDVLSLSVTGAAAPRAPIEVDR